MEGRLHDLAGGNYPRPVDQSRYSDSSFIEIGFPAPQRFIIAHCCVGSIAPVVLSLGCTPAPLSAIVGRKDDQRFIAFTGSFKSFDNAADLIIHVRDRARVMLAPDILENFFVGSNPFRWLVQGIVRSMVCH